jgi:hypothetical protein
MIVSPILRTGSYANHVSGELAEFSAKNWSQEVSLEDLVGLLSANPQDLSAITKSLYGRTITGLSDYDAVPMLCGACSTNILERKRW